MGKNKVKNNKKKEMSEGTAIILAVLGLTVGGVVAYYLLRWVLDFFFPSLLN